MLLATFLGGCCYPGPWRAERIGNTGPFPAMWLPEKTPSNTQYFVGPFFIQAIFRARDETSHSASSPYYFSVAIVTGDNSFVDATIKSVELTVNAEPETDFAIWTRPESQTETTLTVPFTIMHNQDWRPRGPAFSSTPIEIEHSDLKTMTLAIELEIRSQDSTYSGIVRHGFVPKVDKSFWTCVEV